MDLVARQTSGIEANSRLSEHGNVTVRTHRLHESLGSSRQGRVGLVKNNCDGDVRFGLVLFGILMGSRRILTRASEAFEMSFLKKISGGRMC